MINPEPVRTHSQSSNIAHFDYHAAESKLTVEFRNGGKYEYSNVPPAEHDIFQRAASHGKHFHAHIKGKFPTKKLN